MINKEQKKKTTRKTNSKEDDKYFAHKYVLPSMIFYKNPMNFYGQCRLNILIGILFSCKL